jgi:hypothetical protein
MPLSKKQKQLDKTGDGKITREDLMILRSKKIKMAKLSLSQINTLKKHSVHHSKKHMDMMKKLMREGASFKSAHNKAQKQIGK